MKSYMRVAITTENGHCKRCDVPDTEHCTKEHERMCQMYSEELPPGMQYILRYRSDVMYKTAPGFVRVLKVADDNLHHWSCEGCSYTMANINCPGIDGAVPCVMNSQIYIFKPIKEAKDG